MSNEETLKKLAEYYYWRGVSYQQNGDPDKAIADCTKAKKLNSNLADAYGRCGYAYRDKDEFDKAIVEFTKAIEILEKE